MNLPKISVVTPSCNQAAYLEETILSVISQNYPNLEYIVVDGGSEDGSVDIIKKYASHITYWVSEKDNGQSDAINKGFRKCTGDIVTWLCSDDYYLNNVLHKVADYFSQGNFSLLYGRSVLSEAGRKEKLIGPASAENIITKCLAYVPFPQPSTFFRRQVLLEQGYLDETLHFGMDHDLFVKIILNYDVFGADDIFSMYRYHKASKSNFPLKFTEDRSKVFSKVLRSIPGTESVIHTLTQLGYYYEGTDRYTVSKHTGVDLRRALIYFLEIQMHYYYQGLDESNAKTISNFLLHYNDHSINREDARKIHFRATWLNKHFISLIRNLTYN